MSEHLIGIKIKVDGGSASAALASASEGVKNFGEAGQKAGKKANQGMSDAASGADKLNRQIVYEADSARLLEEVLKEKLH